MNKNTDVILRNVKETVAAPGVLSCGDTVIVGVSGGPDSVALLHALFVLRHELGLSLHVAHFNHNWRKSAAMDERFVRRLAGQWGLPCACGRMPGRFARAATAREERGRAQRLRFFQRLAKKINARAIMLGHTQDDLVETVLMHILRGSGLQGMRGMLPHRRIQGAYLIRPLLGVRKKDILAYLQRNGIRYRQDPTNRQDHFLRNRIRLELLPLLEKRYNPGIRGTLSNMADTAGLDYDYLEEQAKKIFGRMAKRAASSSKKKKNSNAVRFNRAAFTRQPGAVKRMLIRLALERLQGSMNRLTLAHMRAIEYALSQTAVDSLVHLPGHLRVRVDKTCLDITRVGNSS